MKKLLFFIILVIIGGYLFLHGCPGSDTSADKDDSEKKASHRWLLSSTSDINLHDVDGGGWNYAFTYGDEDFQTIYGYDCWTIYDSYKITNKHDQKIICQALIDVHPVHGSDLESYRTADDKYLPEDNAWRSHAANVDLDPQDQGRTIEEIYEDRTGQEINLTEKVKEKVEESIEDGTLFQKIKHYVFD